MTSVSCRAKFFLFPVWLEELSLFLQNALTPSGRIACKALCNGCTPTLEAVAETFSWLAEELLSTAEFGIWHQGPDCLHPLWVTDCEAAQRKLSVTIGIHLRGNSQSKTLCGNKHKIYFRPRVSWLFLLASFNIYQSSCWLLINPVLRHLFVHVMGPKAWVGNVGLRHWAAESCCQRHSQIPQQPTELPTEMLPLVKHSTKTSWRHKPVQSETYQLPSPSILYRQTQSAEIFF